MADVHAAWGNITKIELVGAFPTATYTYATNTMSYAGTAADFTLLKSDYNTAFAAIAIPANTNTATNAAAMVAPITGEFTLRITTAGGGGSPIVNELKVNLADNANLEKGKTHKVTIDFDIFRVAIATFQTINEWNEGYVMTDEEELDSDKLPLLPKRGYLDASESAAIKTAAIFRSWNGSAWVDNTSFTISTNTTSYNSYTTNNNGDYHGNGVYTIAEINKLLLAEPAYHKLEIALADESAGSTWAAAYAACKLKAPAGEWRLPRMSELMWIYMNRVELEKTEGFTPVGAYYYWSATENNATDSWYVYFSNGNTGSINRGNTRPVRCVREL